MRRWVRRFAYWWCGDAVSPWVRFKWWMTYRFIDDPRKPRMERCWATSISWALGLDTLDGARASSSVKCREDAVRDGHCYCCRFACRERLVEIGADPDALQPDQWLA